jgi:hypothetical protein
VERCLGDNHKSDYYVLERHAYKARCHVVVVVVVEGETVIVNSPERLKPLATRVRTRGNWRGGTHTALRREGGRGLSRVGCPGAL